LVIAFARAAVGDCHTVFFLGHCYLGAGYHRPSKGGSWRARESVRRWRWVLMNGFLTKEVDVLVDGIALNCWVAELLDEFSTKVLDIDLFSTNFQCLGLGSLEILYSQVN
jgi:hypothetical protein